MPVVARLVESNIEQRAQTAQGSRAAARGISAPPRGERQPRRPRPPLPPLQGRCVSHSGRCRIRRSCGGPQLHVFDFMFQKVIHTAFMATAHIHLEFELQHALSW